MEYSSRGHKEDIENIVIDMAKSGMAMRNFQIKNIYSASVEQKVKRIGVAFAAVVLWK
jgi:pyruvoyl-dependent arginine decarboxylase (PvlArgDC)